MKKIEDNIGIIGLFVGFFLGIFFFTFYPVKYVGGYLRQDGWLIIECKKDFITDLFYRRFIRIRMTDKIVDKHYNLTLK